MNEELQKILNDLQKHKRPKSELMPIYIQERLEKSLAAYYNDVNMRLRYYKDKDGLKILQELGDNND